MFDSIPESEAKRAKVCINIQTKSTLLKLRVDEIILPLVADGF